MLAERRCFQDCSCFLGDLDSRWDGADMSWDLGPPLLPPSRVIRRLVTELNSAAAGMDSDLSCSITAASNFWLSLASLLSRFRPRSCHNRPNPDTSTISFRLMLTERQSRRSSSNSRIWMMCLLESDTARTEGERTCSSPKQTAGR